EKKNGHVRRAHKRKLQRKLQKARKKLNVAIDRLEICQKDQETAELTLQKMLNGEFTDDEEEEVDGQNNNKEQINDKEKDKNNTEQIKEEDQTINEEEVKRLKEEELQQKHELMVKVKELQVSNTSKLAQLAMDDVKDERENVNKAEVQLIVYQQEMEDTKAALFGYLPNESKIDPSASQK
ncbi:MAG: hypothetical protein EZS28_046981, partial [Streblomastix strix]